MIRTLCIALPLAATALVRPACAVGGLVPMQEEPNARAALAVPPVEVTIEFGADFDPKKTSFTVIGPDGKNVNIARPTVSKTDPRMLTVGLKQPAKAGAYTVNWHAVGPDGEKNQGSYGFSVTHAAVTAGHIVH